jgi:hypothetical protein
MVSELEQLQQQDLYAELSSAIESRGARSVLNDFKGFYPGHYQEMYSQMTRHEKPVAALLKKREDE